MPCLVRMCSKERLLEERVEGAETLAYLMEPDIELQRIASVTDHLVSMLADYFKYPSSVSAITDIKRVNSRTHIHVYIYTHLISFTRDFCCFYIKLSMKIPIAGASRYILIFRSNEDSV